jgi:hypothetical protein
MGHIHIAAVHEGSPVAASNPSTSTRSRTRAQRDQVLAAILDVYRLQAGARHSLPDVPARPGPVQAQQLGDAIRHVLQLAVDGDVAGRQPAAGRQHAGGLRQRLLEVPGQAKRALGEHDVHGLVGQGQRLEARLHVRAGGSLVEPEGARPALASLGQRVAGPAPEVDEQLTLLEIGLVEQPPSRLVPAGMAAEHEAQGSVGVASRVGEQVHRLTPPSWGGRSRGRGAGRGCAAWRPGCMS